MDNNKLIGFFGLARQDKIEIPDNFADFLLNDDQGMEGFEFMLKHPILNRRIPKDVREEYEIFYYQIKEALLKAISDTKEYLTEMEKSPEKAVHQIIQSLFEENIEKDND